MYIGEHMAYTLYSEQYIILYMNIILIILYMNNKLISFIRKDMSGKHSQ